MGIGQGKEDKGSGGKRGHSGKDNWMTHQEEKAAGRKRRRLKGKKIVSEETSSIGEKDND